ncbi:MAG: PorT family protein [Prevotella sp.]|nr:PorT family protein [Prevotella sp.]
MIKTKLPIFLFLTAFTLLSTTAYAQVGEHRNDLSVGVNAGYVMSTVSFQPKVVQKQHGGLTGGLSVRYVCEKYFKSICSIYAELNYAQIGWTQDILDASDQPVINSVTNAAETYSRTINYVQVPVFAHLAWGKEHKGMQFFFQAGPQFGYYISESTSMNYDPATRNLADRANSVVAQESMPVEKKFDYGIAAGLGAEYSLPGVGHLLLEARYYYGLGNIYGDSKRDFFGASRFNNIVIKATYLFDIVKTKKER